MKSKIRYSLCPQMKVYDQIHNIWSPYLMFKQDENIRSKFVNTDNYGLRYTDPEGSEKTRYSLFENNLNIKNEEIALVGGSAAFGVGSSSDTETIASKLSLLTQKSVFNLGLRAHNGFQEIINFQILINKFKNLKYIILFSGFNDIFLSKYISKEGEYSPFFYQREFFNRMNYPSESIIKTFLFHLTPPSKRKKINWLFDGRRSILKKIFSTQKNKTYKANKFSADWKIDYEKNFKIWSMISQSMNIKVIYAFQPFFNFCKEFPSAEENKIISEIKSNNTEKVLSILTNMSKDDYINASNFFKKECSKYNFDYVDFNSEFINENIKNKWVFVDSAHLTDYGNSLVAKKLNEMVR